MIKAERHERILSELARRGAISVQELSVMLDVSEATVRRDLNDLDERELVARTHGGVTLAPHGDEPPFSSKATVLLAEKRRIGAMVASLLQPNQVVGCTGGTTIAQVVKALRSRPVPSLRIITNAVNVPMALGTGTGIEVTIVGGLLREKTYELVGHVAERTLADVLLDVALIGLDGLSVEHGLTTYNQAEAYVSRRLVERAEEVWAVADHSKLGKNRPAVIAPLASVTRLVTDADASPETVARLRERGIEVLLA